MLILVINLIAVPLPAGALHTSHVSSHARKSLSERRRAQDRDQLFERRSGYSGFIKKRQSLLGDLGNAVGGALGDVGDGVDDVGDTVGNLIGGESPNSATLPCFALLVHEKSTNYSSGVHSLILSFL